MNCSLIFVPQQRGCALDEVVQFERVWADAPANVATAVARLGGESADDFAGGRGRIRYAHSQNAARKRREHLNSVPHRTGKYRAGVCSILIRTATAEFSFYRNPSADLFLDEAQITPDIFADCAVLHFCSVDLVDRTRQAGTSQGGIRLAKDAGAFPIVRP